MRATTDQSLTPGLQLQLYLLTGLVLLPHVMHLPLPVILFVFAALSWRLVSLRLPRLQPGRWLLFPITLAGVFLIYSQHHTLIGRDAGVSLLSVMLVLKTLEVRKRRDLTVTVYIAYFVIVTQFLFNQTFLLLVYLILVLIGHTALLLLIHRVTPPGNLFEPYRRIFWIALQAVPIALILFVLFPRLTHPLWHFGYDASAVSGLSDRVSPGTISQLIQSSDIAFRVSFKGTPPAAEKRYWRALVLWDTDGRSWFTRKDDAYDRTMPKVQTLGEAVEYRIFLEPHRQHWLYALDLPATSHAGATLTPDLLLRSHRPVARPIQYQGLSFTEYRIEQISQEERSRALRLGEGITQRQRELVKSWRQGTDDAETVVRRALDYFHQQPFVYTLTPPVYRENPVDQFLFDEREGFCEHYATAFTQLMRLTGIPARMVVGFQGGEFNRLGDYYTIRNYDAHAWSEVWLDHQGWVRIDPTAAVAPERVRSTIRPEFGSVGAPVRYLGQQAGWIQSGARKLGMLLDTLEVNWQEWVLGFSQDQQFGLLRGLGVGFLRAGGWGILSILLILSVLGLIALRLLLQGRVVQPPVVRLYQRFCKRLAAVGLPRAPREGPLDYSTRVSHARPDLAPKVREITRLYIGLRYGARQTRPQQQAFIDRVRRFRPRRLSRGG